jgi:UDP-N-acetylglucosamine 4,6-dehydratase
MGAVGTKLGTVLVTGGTGTFGQAFARKVLDDNLVDRLIVFSRDEAKQARMAAEFADPRLVMRLGDVRDQERLALAFQGVDRVVHAAALKQVDRSALDIMEFVKTNIYGTQNVITAAHTAKVFKVLILSTDKAVSSSTPYGATKSVAEWLAVAGNVYGSAKIATCRYGNVIGSRGSVLETWNRQYMAGEPLPITDERMTRFWIGIWDAVDLALLALNRMCGGEIFIPKDLNRSRIVDFAQQHFLNPEFMEVGKRSYEKIHEVLVASEEVDRLVDCGDVYVLLPMHVRWSPGPYGVEEGVPVEEGFEYRSDG